VREIQRLLPGEDIVYFGDTARVPYGTKSKETVTRFSRENVEFLLRFNVKLIVVACNTASSLSLGALSRSFDVPVIGVIKPGVRKALEVAAGGTVGIIGTRATISSGAYARSLRKANPSLRILSRPCPLFVPLVEEGWLDNGITKRVIEKYLAGFRKRNMKALILGCTHYPLLKPALRRYMGRSVRLIDSAEETAKTVKSVLAKRGQLSGRKRASGHRYFVTDEPSEFRKVGGKFLGGDIRSIRRVWRHV
jgi:glutamate racemase